MRAALALLCLATCGTAVAAAQVVDIAWTAEGRFTHTATLAPRELLEVCGKLPRGAHVAWTFEAGAPLPFNIHVHQGKDVVYPARLERAARAQGVQVFDAEPAHCWMWTNTDTKPVKIDVDLRQHRR